MIKYQTFTIPKTRFLKIFGAVCVDNNGLNLPHVVYFEENIKGKAFNPDRRIIALLSEHNLKHTGQVNGLLTFEEVK